MGVETIFIIVLSAIIIGVLTTIKVKASNKREVEDFYNTIKQYEENNSIYLEDKYND